MKNKNIIKTIGITAPASSFKTDGFVKAKAFLKKMGLKTLYTNTIFKKDGFNAGTSKQRAQDIIKMIRDQNVDAVFFARGGYGCSHILPYLEKEKLRAFISPKLFMGYSDITALFCYLYSKYGKECIYGPNVTSHYFQNNTLIRKVLEGKTGTKQKIKILNSCKGTNAITAPVFGGCLSVLASMAGTPYLRKLKGHILFVEDTNEAPYKIDRMLTQLIQSETLKGIKAIAVGAMENCDSPNISWKDVISKIAKELNVPAIYGITAGHAGFGSVIRLGAQATIDIRKKEFKIND